jgi:hypothetical protein
MKSLVFVTLLITANVFSQNLIVKSNGSTVKQGKTISTEEVRTILASQPQLLEMYNSGRTKKTAGNILMIGGLGLVTADLLTALNSDVQYPSAVTFIGGALFVASIPVKIGYLKKIKNSINEYNTLDKKTSFTIDKIEIINNRNGLGVAIQF